VIGQPRAADVLPCFLSFLARGTPVAHNAAFDVGFLCPDIQAGLLEPPFGPVLDTRALARRAFPGRYSYSLANLARDFSLPPAGDAHRALADAIMCGNLLVTCVEALLSGREPCAEELARMSGPLDFGAHAPRLHVMAALLDHARKEGREVEIDYRSGQGETTRRRIRPLRFTRVGSSIAVIAWCYLRGGNRTFILDSITSARIDP
jgi:DNA polymerase III epsilon subunit-like protein